MRQVRLLEGLYDLTVAGFGASPATAARYILLEKPPTSIGRKGLWVLLLLSGAFESYYWDLPQVKSALEALRDAQYDLIIANDLSALPVALQLAGRTPVLFDAHEYSPREYEDQLVWRLLFQRYNQSMCARYLPRVASMTTVCQGIANAYAAEYGVQPRVVHNAPLDQHLVPSLVDNSRIRLIHHGIASHVRRLELMIDMVLLLEDRFTMDFMLVEAEPKYLASLVARAKGDPRINFLAPVPMSDICKTINAYDVGVFLLRPDNFNYQHALPNKFFEFVQARLAVAIGPSPEMKSLVERYRCGVVAESFEPQALARILNALTVEDIYRMKSASNLAAAELSYEHDGKQLLDAIDSLISSQ